MKKIITLSVVLLLICTAQAQGDLHIGPGATLYTSGSSTVTLQNARLTNNGSLTANDGTVVFRGNGTNAQSGINGTGATAFKNLTVDKTANGAQLNQNISVTGNLTLTSGSLVLAGSYVDFGNTGSLQSETAVNKVSGIGYLRRVAALNAPSSVNPGNLGAVLSAAHNLGSTEIRRAHQSVSASSAERAYDIRPTTAGTSSVTLYFTQAEFDAYNALSPNDLPANGADAAGKTVLRIKWYEGVSSDGSGAENTYPGVPVVINPDDNNIVWNMAQNRWELSFTTDAIGGFFVFAVEPCPDLSAAPAEVIIYNGICGPACEPVGASISPPGGLNRTTDPVGPCPEGSTLEYQVNGGDWTTTLPVYAAGLTIKTRCVCDNNPSTTSPASDGVTTNPANCTDNTPPTATCSNATISFNGEESIALNANALVTAGDNCGIQSIQLLPSSISSAQVGQTVPVTITVTDITGNVSTCTANVTVSGLPAGWNQTPGGIGCTSSCTDFNYNMGTGVWTGASTGAYYGPPFTGDAAAFAQRTLCGDGSITAQVTSATGGGWAGVMMRESNDVGAKKAQLMANLGAQNRREFRTETNGVASPQQFTSLNRYWLRIVRAGNQFTLYTSPNGTTWYAAGTQNIAMSNCIQMGLVVTNNTPNSTVTATFAGVSYSGSNSELGSPLTGHGLTPLDSPLTPEFEVFPNPTSGDLNVDLTQYVGRAVRMEVYSIEGKLLQFREIDEVQTTLENLNLSQYAGGMYFIKVQSRDLPEITKRVVLQQE